MKSSNLPLNISTPCVYGIIALAGILETRKVGAIATLFGYNGPTQEFGDELQRIIRPADHVLIVPKNEDCAYPDVEITLIWHEPPNNLMLQDLIGRDLVSCP